MFSGLLDLSWPALVGVTLLFTHTTIAAVTIYLHRHQAHRALDLHPAVSHFFRFWLWLTTGMVTREWVGVHRKHHAAVDGPDDPHSPRVVGIRRVLLQGAELYREAASNIALVERFGRGTPDDWLERRLYRRHSRVGVTLMLGADLLLFGVIGLTVWAVQMLWIPVFAAGVINGLGHWGGYRNHECEDASRNIVPWGVLIGGEELHNNHHAYASSARLSNRWWEFDIGWFYIRVLAAVGLARVRRIAPRPVFVRTKDRIDLATARAIVRTRFRVMRHYTRQVVRPVAREELRRHVGAGRRLLRRARRVLLRGPVPHADPVASATLASALGLSERLKIVQEFRLALQGLWQRGPQEAESLLAGLQEWCARAERSGVAALAQFSRSLRGYSLKAASQA